MPCLWPHGSRLRIAHHARRTPHAQSHGCGIRPCQSAFRAGFMAPEPDVSGSGATSPAGSHGRSEAAGTANTRHCWSTGKKRGSRNWASEALMPISSSLATVGGGCWACFRLNPDKYVLVEHRVGLRQSRGQLRADATIAVRDACNRGKRYAKLLRNPRRAVVALDVQAPIFAGCHGFDSLRVTRCSILCTTRTYYASRIFRLG